MLQSFNVVPHVVVTSTIKLFSLLPRNCSFVSVMNHNANIWVFLRVLSNLCEKILWPPKGVMAHRLRIITLNTRDQGVKSSHFPEVFIVILTLSQSNITHRITEENKLDHSLISYYGGILTLVCCCFSIGLFTHPDK